MGVFGEFFTGTMAPQYRAEWRITKHSTSTYLIKNCDDFGQSFVYEYNYDRTSLSSLKHLDTNKFIPGDITQYLLMKCDFN